MTSRPRILLLYASVGMGHYRAATALQRAFEQIAGAAVWVEDILCYSGAFFRKSYTASYQIAYRMPRVWSQFYALTDRRVSSRHPFAITRSLSTKMGVHELAPLLAETRPDAIVCTHFLPVEALSAELLPDLPPVYLAVTDYRAHYFWACPGIDGYFVPSDATREQLAAAGVPNSRVHVTGIPIDPSIAQPRAQAAVRSELGLPLHGPVVLLNGGGLVPKRVRAIAEALLARRFPGTLLVVARGNHEFIATLADLETAAPGVIRLWGQQPSLDPFIVASDLVVGKAGGLTVSEVLARGVPLLIPTPTPGQEGWNAAHVVAGGAGMCCDSPDAVAQAVMTLLEHPTQRRAMAKAACALGRPRAASAIAQLVLADIARRSRRDESGPAARVQAQDVQAGQTIPSEHPAASEWAANAQARSNHTQ